MFDHIKNIFSVESTLKNRNDEFEFESRNANVFVVS